MLGFDIRIRYLGYAVKVYIVPRVEHHLAALQVMTSDRFPKEAYTEWAALVGEIQKRLLDTLARTVPPRLGGQPLVESSGGETRAGDGGSPPATHFKEAEIMGHPVAYLAILLDSNGALRANAAGETGGADGIGGGDGATAAGFLQRWGAWSAGCFSDPNACSRAPDFPVALLSAAFQIQDYGAALLTAVQDSRVDFPAIAKTLRTLGAQVADQVGAGGVKIDRLLCRNDVAYFYPYYLSGVDALFWRSGAPITDATHLATMLDPFSPDRIGPAGARWGHLYPRHGFVNNDHPGHVAVVAAARSADLVADHRVTLRPKRTTGYAHGHWQSLSPQPTAYCAANIGDLPTPIDPEGGYAHAIWPRFECPLSEVGTRVAFIPYRYCFTWE